MTDNCSILEPWSVMSGVGGGGHWAPDLSRESDALMRALQASFSDPKGPDILAHESDVIAAALQASLYQPIVSTTTTTTTNNSHNFYNHQHPHQDLSSYLSSPSSMDLYSSPSSQLLPSPTTPSSAPLFAKPDLVPVPPLAPVSDSDSPPPAAKKPRPGGISTGRVSKRRPSRASKRSPTTFISADPANFRQMVQEVTGVQIPTMSGSRSCHLSSPLLSRPEPHRLSTASQQGRFFPVRGGASCLPTLDSSAYLLDQTAFVDPPSAQGAPSSSTSSPGAHPPAPPSTTTTTTTTSVSFPSGGLDMGLPCFPTLESSWEVM